MDGDYGYIVMLSHEQKEKLDKYIEKYPSSFITTIQNNLQVDRETWTADISKQTFCLAIIELKKKGEFELARRLIEVGKIQDPTFENTLRDIELDYGRLHSLFN